MCHQSPVHFLRMGQHRWENIQKVFDPLSTLKTEHVCKVIRKVWRKYVAGQHEEEQKCIGQTADIVQSLLTF